VGVSKDGTAANTALFMNAWDAILERTTALTFDFTLKLDPDAVLVAHRVREHLGAYVGQNTFVRNCNKAPDNPDFPMMFGSMEVLTQKALWTYKGSKDRCKNELDWYAWGEDLFLGKCLLHLGVGPADDFSIISDGVCTGVNCYDDWSAAFHPFKSPGAWIDCWNAATSSKGSPALALPEL
jgi:hypothetical protein